MVHTILEDIILAKNSGAYIAALALALTIPDVCGQQQYGKKKFGQHYIDWFDSWVYQFYSFPDSTNSYISKSVSASKFDGQKCYALRCALLHAGNTELNITNVNKFELCVSGISNHCGDTFICNVSDNQATNIQICLNVVGLIDAMLMGAKNYLDSTGNVSDSYGNIVIELY